MIYVIKNCKTITSKSVRKQGFTQQRKTSKTVRKQDFRQQSTTSKTVRKGDNKLQGANCTKDIKQLAKL